MGQFTPEVDQSISNRLIHRSQASCCMQLQRPRCLPYWFRRIIQAHCNAELALFPVCVFFQRRTFLIRREVDVGRFYWLSDDDAYSFRKLKMKKLSNTIVVGMIASRTLSITQIEFSHAYKRAEITAQGGNVEWMNDPSHRSIAFFSNFIRRTRQHREQSLVPDSFMHLGYQYSGQRQRTLMAFVKP